MKSVKEARDFLKRRIRTEKEEIEYANGRKDAYEDILRNINRMKGVLISPTLWNMEIPEISVDGLIEYISVELDRRIEQVKKRRASVEAIAKREIQYYDTAEYDVSIRVYKRLKRKFPKWVNRYIAGCVEGYLQCRGYEGTD